MIVGTSTLIAILLREPGAGALLDAIAEHGAFLPAPARVEFLRVAAGARVDLGREAHLLLGHLERLGLDTAPFTNDHPRIAADANARYGKGMAGGSLKLLDLMVYAVAKERNASLLFTGNDFAGTDVTVHTASRLG